MESWRRYRRALRAEDQQALDLLFAAARKHSAAGAYLARETPFDVMVMSMLLEQQQQLLRLQQKVRDLEANVLPQPPHGVAP
jgi:hypothetical protein